SIGQPKKIALIFGRKVTRQYKGKLQTELEDLDLPNPVIRSHYAHGFAKQYVRDDRLLRTEHATNDVTDYGVNKNVENLPPLRQRMSEIIDHYHDAQQDILETFIDRGQLQKLAEPTTLTNGKRIPGLKLDHPRQLAVMHALVRFSNIAAGGRFTTADLYAPTLDTLGLTESQYSLACRHSAVTTFWPKRNAANSTACINTSATVWMRSYGLAASRPLLDLTQPEQNSRWGPYNGNSRLPHVSRRYSQKTRPVSAETGHQPCRDSSPRRNV